MCGVVGSIANLITLSLLTEFGHVFYVLSAIIGILVGLVFNYFLNYYFTFHDVLKTKEEQGS